MNKNDMPRKYLLAISAAYLPILVLLLTWIAPHSYYLYLHYPPFIVLLINFAYIAFSTLFSFGSAFCIFHLANFFYKKSIMKENILKTKDMQARKLKLELVKSVKNDEDLTSKEKENILNGYENK
ncbi:hypothetical protein [Apilactobacillus timberlakei]|uniref:hypothetical protein n=1 Tax=Apilactobacillus timberlakei TaxID=2008380 RepID=UPI00112D433A|nr:hypothetical protein [Apilactobacillus timberlakei]TPR16280.1 hypothetical protein DYZ95_07890 [Apilactobacillus timberlakei]TPR21549.1 hypothetical protein DY083_05880 [Apilactobacillus timberlakei]